MARRELLTPSEIESEFPALRRNTLAKWRMSGDGPPFLKIGRLVYYDPAVVERWLERQTRSSTTDDGFGLTRMA